MHRRPFKARFGKAKFGGVLVISLGGVLAGCGRNQGGESPARETAAVRLASTSVGAKLRSGRGRHFSHHPPPNCHPHHGNVCPVIEVDDSGSPAPLTAVIGEVVALSGSATDADGPSPLTYTWTSTGGSVAAASGSDAQFTCTALGQFDVTLTVSDGDCADAATVEVVCAPPVTVSQSSSGPPIALNEVGFVSEAGAPDGWIEIYNAGDAPIDLSLFVMRSIEAGQGAQTFTLPAGTTVAAGGYFVIDGLSFGAGGASVSFSSPDGTTVFDASWVSAAGTSYTRWQGVGPFVVSRLVTQGRPYFPCNVGAAMGDVHFRTFDGLQYDMQGAGQYTLVHDGNDGLEIQIQTAPWRGRTDVSVNVAADALIAGDRVVFYLDGSVHLNGLDAALPEGATTLPGGGQIERTGSSFKAIWPEGTELRVSPFEDSLDVIVILSQARLSAAAGQVAGLLGNANCNTADDLTTRDQSLTISAAKPPFQTLYGAFAASWCVLPSGSLFDPAPGAPTACAFPTTLAALEGLKPDVRQAANAVCEAQGVPADWLDACTLDVALSGNLSAAFADDLAGVPPTSAKVQADPCGVGTCGSDVECPVAISDGGSCGDHLLCITGSCQPIACEGDAECGDGNVCNGVETCSPATHTCLPGSLLDCDDQNACTADSCDPALGCGHVDVPCGGTDAGSGGGDATSGGNDAGTGGASAVDAGGGSGGTAGSGGGTAGSGGGTAGSAGAGGGGGGGAGGSQAGDGGVPVAGTTVVATQGFETGVLSGEWVVDSSLAHDGASSAHPPTLAAAGSADLSYSCEDSAHSQLTFWWFGNPAAGESLNFYVDGILNRTVGSSFIFGLGVVWQQVSIVVPTGQHSYRWQEVAAAGGAPGFFVDSITCANTTVQPNTSGSFGFEEKFVPPEVTGTWQIDNSGPHDGQFSAHPPLLPGGAGAESSEMDFSCADKQHSQLTFWWFGNPAAGESLNFYVDGALNRTLGSSFVFGLGVVWQQISIVVPTGQHSYRWQEVATAGGAPGFLVDSIACANTPVQANTSGSFGFEEKFVPPEVTGTWQIDNSGPHDGQFSAHPPLLTGGAGTQSADMLLSCGDSAHAQMTFWYYGNPPAGESLNVYVDGVLNRTLGSSFVFGEGVIWQQQVVPVAAGLHTYRWQEVATAGGAAGFYVDSINCASGPVIAAPPL
jgi:von Willebrand factor type D domain/Lamin Tail Domain